MEKKEEFLCSVNCPFLALRSFLPNTMPFFCSKYNTFLGISPAQKPVKFPPCRGKQAEIISLGLSLLETQNNSVSELKAAFLKMLAIDQRRLVDLLSRYGVQLNFDKKSAINPLSLSALVKKLSKTFSSYETSEERQEFLRLLKLIGESGSPMDPMTQSLLANLFQVVDGSEKAMLLAIMQNPSRLKAFLKQFSKIPQNQSMLKNFRALLYDYDRQEHQTRPVQLTKVIQRMTRLQMVKARQRQKTRE